MYFINTSGWKTSTLKVSNNVTNILPIKFRLSEDSSGPAADTYVFEKRKKFLVPAGNQTPECPVRGLVTTLTELTIMNGMTAEVSGSANLKAALFRVCRSVIGELLMFWRNQLPSSSGTSSALREIASTFLPLGTSGTSSNVQLFNSHKDRQTD
jgi:hypothetical protein